MPYWYLILEAANGDPLRAQEIEVNISQEWWERWMANRDAIVKAKKARDDE